MGGHEASGTAGRFWRIAVLTVAGALGSASQAEAALYYWSDFHPGYYQPAPAAPQRRPMAGHRQAKKIQTPESRSAKPHGPLIIAISIEKQNLKIYDANGFFAETPISTGMKGHPTPMGVFSVIQKHRLHHSNIYSGAPMPYMQRITWSGIAMHAGVLPGYPASHGCIRMPTAFAIKMWNWTRMGVRVVVTASEMTPKKFSHPLLVAQKIAPQPVIGAPASRLHEQTHTADASNGMPAAKALVTMTDAARSDGNASPLEESAATIETAKPHAAKSEPERAIAKRDDTFSDKSVEIKSPDAATAEIKSAEIGPAATEAANKKPDETQVQATNDAANIATSAIGSVNAEAKMDELKAEVPTPDTTIKAVTEVSPGDDAKNNEGNRSRESEKPTSSKPDPAPQATPKRTGQITVLISRKDSRLYVRQNFAPLFDAPVTIAPSDRPLGTHVFTAQVDKEAANAVNWSVVSLPVPSRYAERRDEDERISRRRRIAGVVEMNPMPDSPAEALDRLTIPSDAMARIAEALSTGGSIIVSDQGIAAGETGEGTDFIVSLH